MNILIYTAHPAHVHFFKNFIFQSDKNKIKCHIIFRKKDITQDLLQILQLDKLIIGSIKQRKQRIGLLIEFIISVFYFIYIIIKYRIDLSMGIGGESLSVSSRLLFKKSSIFTDTEHARTTNTISFLFANNIVVPSCYMRERNRRTIEYNGYHELSYLHPNRFKPNPQSLEKLGLKLKDTFFIIRFVSWEADHDIGQKGFTQQGKIKIVKTLEKYGKVIISSENKLPSELEKYRMTISPIKMHDLLYYATMYIGEGGTMASEAAVLGTPAIFVSSLVLGYLDELENEYGLMFTIKNEKEAIDKISTLLKTNNIKKEWLKKRNKMLKDKVDVTQWMVDFIAKKVYHTEYNI